jgi:hypothetical protein
MILMASILEKKFAHGWPDRGRSGEIGRAGAIDKATSARDTLMLLLLVTLAHLELNYREGHP